MSSKSHGKSSTRTATTPRRLRSGTPYGDTTCQPPTQPKKDSKKTVKEPPTDPYQDDSDSEAANEKEKPTKTSKNNSTHHVEQLNHRSHSHCSSSSTVSSPKQCQKGQTLKAILESIETNFSLKSKSSKRKTLRDLLDQKMCKERECVGQKSNAKEHTKPAVSDKSSNTPENNHHYKKHVDKDSTNDKKIEKHKKSETSPKQNTTHTQTTTDSRSFVKVKDEQPDDYWAMRQNYSDKTANRNSSVELRIKADGPTGNSDDHSQTFRISCSRPESSEHSPGASHRSMKPDIVLKVRPRSSSLSALRDSKRPVEAYKTTGRFNGCLESQSTILSTISPLSFKANSGYSNGVKHRYNYSNSSLHTHGVVLQDGPVLLKRGLSVAKSLNFEQLEQHDVVEESNLPPVANTVELLSEPHDYHHHQQASKDPPFQLTDYSLIANSHHVENFTDKIRDSPEPPVLEPMTLIKTEPRQDSDVYGGLYEEDRIDCKVKEEAVGLWGEPGIESLRLNERLGDVLVGGGGCSPMATVFPTQEKEETEDEGSSRAEDDEGGDDDNGDEDVDGVADTDVRRIIARRKSKTRDDGDFSSHAAALSASASASDETGSRRRRKGRPSRKAKTERRWQTADLCLSPREEEEEEEDDEEDGGSSTPKGKHKNRHGKSVSKSASFNTKKGSSGKKQGDAGSGVRRPRKSVDLEAQWADPQLDTHAFLLWASENRCEVERQNRAVSAAGVEDLLATQWRQLPFSSKLHFLCRARDASTDHSKYTGRKKKAATVQKKDPPPTDGRSVYEEFLRLPQERQKDLLRKWLRFFQKMLPRLEYQDFISDFKKACKSLQLRPVPARRKNARLRNLDPSHYHMLFEKIRETRPRVISVYNKRKAREEELLKQSFNAMIRRLICGQPWPFVRGCRSKLLGELLKDIQQLEVEEVLAQIDLPLTLSADLPDPFTAKDLTGPGSLTSDNVATDSGSGDPGHSTTDSNAHGTGTTINNGNNKDGHQRKGSSTATGTTTINNNTINNTSNSNGNNPLCSSVCTTPLSLCGGPAGDAELPDSPFVLNVLDGLRHAADMPILDQKCLDSVFLGPPSRSRSQTPRDTQFQNSATYRRTLLYKHIQPLLDSRGMPLPSSALFHSHTAQYFYPDDR